MKVGTPLMPRSRTRSSCSCDLRLCPSLSGQPVTPARLGDLLQHGRIADVAALPRSRRGTAHPPPRPPLPCCLREVDQLVRGDRVRRALHAVEREGDALARAFLRHARIQRAALLHRAELGAPVVGARHALLPACPGLSWNGSHSMRASTSPFSDSSAFSSRRLPM